MFPSAALWCGNNLDYFCARWTTDSMSSVIIVPITVILLLMIFFPHSPQCLNLAKESGAEIKVDSLENLGRKSFAVSYKVRAIVDELTTHYVSQIHERYNRDLRWASIWMVKQNLNEATARKTQYIYNENVGEFALDEPLLGESFETKTRSFFPTNLRLFDDGAERQEMRTKNTLAQSMRLMDINKDDGGTIEQDLLKLESDLSIIGLKQLNLLYFLSESCMTEMRQRDLHYLRGLSRLFLLLECRKDEFKQVVEQSKLAAAAANSANIYRAENLEAKQTTEGKFVEYLDVLVESDGSSPHDGVTGPKRVSLKFAPKVTLIIEPIGFELFDSSSGHTTDQDSFRLPLTSSDLVALVNSTKATHQSDTDHQLGSGIKPRRRSFSFVAHLTNSLALLDPIELQVAFDGGTSESGAGILARQVNLVDRGQIVGDTWRRHTTRTVYSKETGLKYHMMHPTGRAEGSTGSGAGAASCLVDSLGDSELSALDTTIDGYQLLELDGALFMGIALVRGVECRVYEKKIHRLPLWLTGGSDGDLDTGSGIVTEGKDIYLTLYERSAAGGPTDDPIPVLLTIDMLSPPTDGAQTGRKIHPSLRVSIQQFSWARSSTDQARLFDISQDCLLSSAAARHARLDLLMGQVEGNTALASYELSDSQSSLREELFSQLISQLFRVAKLEQFDLQISQESARQFHVSATLYELQPSYRIEAALVGLAPSPTRSELAGQSMRLNVKECQLEAAHRLWASSSGQNMTAAGAAKVRAMFCPRTLHCLLLPELREDDQHLASISQADQDQAADGCSMTLVSLVRINQSADAGASRESKLLQWKEKIADAQQKSELIGTPIELHLDGARQMSFTMRLNNIAMSNPT